MKEKDLIPGKWYKNSKNWSYHLYVKLNNYDGTYMHYTEKVIPPGIYKIEEFCCAPNISTLEEATLEEIQQYLPDNHPDKIKPMKTLPEKWYMKVIVEKLPIINKWIGENTFNFSSRSCIYYNKNASDTINVPKDYKEITFEQFKKYVLKQETMKAELFSITGSPALLKAMWEELMALGYYQNDRKYTPERKEIESITNNNAVVLSKQAFKEIVCINWTNANKVQFTLPSQYNEALAFAKAQLAPKLWEEPEVKLPFADLTFIINKSKGTATCKYGTITKAEIKAVIDAIVAPKAKLLSYDLEFTVAGERYLKFGCKTGTLLQAQAILKALE